jgi:RimJ/RimL family protein N-acetyltransferase
MLDATHLPLRSPGAVLRALRPSDARAYAVGAADPATREFAHLPEPEYTEESVLALIDGAISEGWSRGDLAVLAIADPVTDAFAGSLVLFGADQAAAEVGFWVHPDHRGRHLAAAALALAAQFASRCGLTVLTARTVPENRASARVLDQAGYSRGDTLRDVAPSGQEILLHPYHRTLAETGLFPLVTDRLRLRWHDHADAGALQRIYGRPDVPRYLLEEPWSPADAARHLSERVARTGLDSGSTALALVIERDGEVIGDVQLWLTDIEHRIAEIGWVLDPACSGQGLATEAVRATLDLAFRRYDVHRVAAQMDARNTASARLAQRVGMQREAHLRQDWWSKGEWTDTVIYGMLAGDT